MKLLYIILIILAILILVFLFMPVKMQIIRNDKKNDVNAYLVKVLNLRLDLDEALKKIFKTDEKMTLEMILKGISTLKIYNRFLKRLMGIITIKKCTVSFTLNSILLSVTSWNSIYLFRNFVQSSFLDIENEYYKVDYNEDKNNVLNLEIIFYIRGIYFVYAYISSVNDIIKNKRKGSVLSVGTSNK